MKSDNHRLDDLASRLIMAASQLDANDDEVIEALLLALIRYVGPLQFSVLLSRLMPSSNA